MLRKRCERSVSRAKTNAPSLNRVMARICELEAEYDPKHVHDQVRALPPFFHYAYQSATLHQIVYLRERLRYQKSTRDCMVAALVLGSLHGETERSQRFLSNQMPHTISTITRVMTGSTLSLGGISRIGGQASL